MASKDFKPKLTTSASPVPFRKTTDLLPGYLQTDLLKKFFGVTVDQWFQPAQQENVSGYIGEKSGIYYKPDQDFYINESTESRSDYQLEPTAVSVDNNNNTNFVQFYQDLIDSLEFDGALVNNHDRLFSQEYYSWCPPINPDMFINFSNYYWVRSGPATQTITVATNAVLDIIGKAQYTTSDGIELQSGMSILFSNDANSEYNNIKFIVGGVGTKIQLIDDSLFDNTNQYDVPPYDTTPYDAVAAAGTPNYWTIQRGSQDGNQWSRSNRWFHKNILGAIDVSDTTFIQARRPIIEFIKNIELRNSARWARPDVRLISTSDQLLDIIGQPAFELDGLSLEDGNLILFTGDSDVSKNNRVYQVFGIADYGQIGLALVANGLDQYGAPVAGEGIKINRGIVNGNSQYYYDGTSWVLAQMKITDNQPPIFNLYDLTGIRLDDVVEYPASTFTGSKLFNYVEDSSAAQDPYLNIPLNFTTFGELNFTNLISDQRFSFNRFGATTEINGYYFFKTFETAADLGQDKFENDWHKSATKSRQLVRDTYVIQSVITSTGLVEFNREYAISIVPDANLPNELFNYRVLLNGRVLKESDDYSVTDSTLELSLTLSLRDNDVLEIQSWAKIIPELLADGYFQIPTNLQSNPDNQQIGLRSFNEINTQMGSIISNQDGLLGTAFGINNYNSTPRDLSLGLLILNHKASLLRTALLTGNNPTKLTDSIRFSNREYNTFKQKFLIKLEMFNQQGYTASTPTATWIGDALKQINLGKTDTFPFAYSAMTSRNNYIPNSPAALGVTPVYYPSMYVDNTRKAPVTVIQGHDGSLYTAYGDARDQVIIDFELEIYNNISTKYSATQQINEYPVISERPGYFRNTDYSFEDWNTVAQPAFERWVVKKQIDYVKNNSYDSANPFSWNYSRTKLQDGTFAPGSWRGIYNFVYDTDRPHTHPWEMFGLSQKPTWWETEYGPAPYTADNLVLWNDVKNGVIKHGLTAGTYGYLARPGILSMIPVDSFGNLLDPVSAGVVVSTPDIVSAQADWKFGDIGPGEYNWRISSSYSFDLAETMFLTKPARFVETFWERDKFAIAFDQAYNVDEGVRLTSSNLNVHNEILDNGTRKVVRGISSWVSDYLSSVSLNIKENFGDLVRQLNVKLAYKTGAFIKNQNLRVVSDSFGVVPNENLTVKLYKSASIAQPIYSAVIVLWDGSNYRVVGYDSIAETFKYFAGEENGPRSEVIVDNITVSRYDQAQRTVTEIPYYTSFPTRESVYNFLIGYQRYLESQGWVFDDYDSITSQPKNFDTAARQFLRWSQVQLKTGQSIIFSPASDHLVLSVDHGHIENIQGFVNGVYGILDRTGFGITDDKFSVDRLDNRFELTLNADSVQGVYCLRLSLVEFEHIILLDNVTKFNDQIYDPVLGVRQPRFRIFENRTKFWNGKPQALGFIIQEDDLIDNFEYSVDNLRRFFDFDWQPATGTQADLAMHTIGFQERDYTIDLMLDKSTEFDFYRGFIRNKGTKESFDNVLRSTYITKTADFDILEEWAFNIGTYGNVERRSSIELAISQTDFVTNPQVIDFVNVPGTNPTIIDIVPNDTRWVLQRQNNLTNNQFSNRGFKNKYRKDLPNAGYIQLNETTYTITKTEDFEALFNTVVYENSSSFNDGDTIWTIIKPNGDWGVQRVCVDEQIASITQGENVGDPTIITTRNNHSVSVGDVILLQKTSATSQNLQGFHTVLSVPTANSFTVEDTIDVSKIFTSFNFTSDFTQTNPFTSTISGGLVDNLPVRLTTAGTLPDGFSLATTYYIVNVDENSFGLALSEDGEQIVPLDNGVGTFTASRLTVDASIQNVYTLKSIRFETNNERDAFTPHAGWLAFDRTFVDNNGSNLWSVFSRSDSTPTWNVVRTEIDKVDIDQVYNVFVYDSITNIDSIELDLYDPYKGLIISAADRELYYKLNYDPAKYNTGDAEVYQIDPEQAWSSNQVGRLWWDLSTVRYLDYEQGTLDYRRKNWGKLAPGVSVDVYEWTRSSVPPANWDSYVLSLSNSGNNRPSGTAIYGSDTPYVIEQQYNQAKNILENVYYFWVKTPNTIPDGLSFRKFSALDVTQLIKNANSQSIAMFAPIANNAFVVLNAEPFINGSSSVLQITFYDREDESTIHKQWILQRELDTVNKPYEGLWNKMRDSLVGFDDLNKSVPDINLKPVERYGNSIRPRQTWFVDRLQARLQFFEKVNKILLPINTTNIVGWDDNLFSSDPLPASTNYDYQVITRADRNAFERSIQIGKKVLVEHDEGMDSLWTLWQYAGGSSWTLLNQQLFRVSDYWKRIDWYSEGYDSNTRIYYTWADIPTMNNNVDLYQDGFVLKVLDDGSGTWSLYLYTKVNGLDTFSLIAQEQGTIQFLTNLSNYDVSNAAVDLQISTATKQILVALQTNLLTILQQNQLFFTMVHYVHTEQTIVPWVFKTSLVVGQGNPLSLEQEYISNQNLTDSLVNYFDEAKPYHVKLRALTEQRQIPMESVNGRVTDDRFMVIKLIFDRITQFSNIPEGANPANYDISKLSTADRIQLFYKPTEGMPPKVLSQLISRSEFAGTIVDGLTFWQFGANMMAGYGNQAYDDNHLGGYDFDPADIENLYDVFINGGQFLIGPVSSITVIDGGQDYEVDDVVLLVDSIGKNARAIVTAINVGNGAIVDVNVIDGGMSYTQNVSADVKSDHGFGAILKVNTLLNPPTFAGVADSTTTINLDGNQFVQPEIDEDHPEELTKVRAGDALSIDVFTANTGFNARYADVSSSDFNLESSDRPNTAIKYPTFRIKRFSINSPTQVSFNIGQLPQSKQALFIYLDGVLLKEGVDYTVDWNTAIVSLITPVSGEISQGTAQSPTFAAGDTLQLGSYTVALSTSPYNLNNAILDINNAAIPNVIASKNSANQLIITNTTNELQFALSGQVQNKAQLPLLSAQHSLVINSFGTGGGTVLKSKTWKNTNMTTFNTNIAIPNGNNVFVMVDGVALSFVNGDFTVSGTNVTIINPTISNSVVTIVVFDSGDFSQIVTEYVTVDANHQATISRPAFTTQPAYIGTHVFKNGLRLSPPSMKAYTEKTDEKIYKTTVTPSDPSKVRVWRDGIELTPGIDFNRFFVNGVIINSPGTNYAIGDAINIVGAGLDATAEVSIVDTNGGIVGISMLSNGNDYSGITSATITSSTGSGAILEAQVSQDEVELLIAATGTVKILIVVEENGDYTITDGVQPNDTITVSSANLGDTLEVSTYSDDITYGMITETFAGIAAASYALGGVPYNTNSIFVYVNGIMQVFGQDFKLVDQVLGYDSEVDVGYGDVYDSLTNLSVVFLKGSHELTDKIVITYFSGLPAEDTVGFKLFKNIFGKFEYLRISDANSTTLTAPLLSTDKTIVVADATVLGQPDLPSQTPGVIFIMGERITFWTVDTTTPGLHILGQCSRGTAGTGVNADLQSGMIVRDASKNQQIPGGWNWEFTPDGVLYSQSQQAKFLRASPGNIR